MTRDDAYARAVELNSEVYPYGVDTGTLIEEIYDEHEVEIAKLQNKIIKLKANLKALGAIK